MLCVNLSSLVSGWEQEVVACLLVRSLMVESLNLES